MTERPAEFSQPTSDPAAPRPPKLLERMRIHLRTRHYSIRTEEAYIDWARRFIVFHGKRHPQEMGTSKNPCFQPLNGQDAQLFSDMLIF